MRWKVKYLSELFICQRFLNNRLQLKVVTLSRDSSLNRKSYPSSSHLLCSQNKILKLPSIFLVPNACYLVTHYDVIEEVADELGWKVINSMKSSTPWDILWTDHHIQPDLLIRLQLFQKVSHYPGIHVLSRKNLLGLSLMDMFKRVPTHYDFFPKTWLLPAQYSEFRKEFNGEEKTYIVKPEADCQGRGIFLTQRV